MRSTPNRDEPFPNALGRTIRVPEEMVNAGTPTNLPRDEPPETLDSAPILNNTSNGRPHNADGQNEDNLLSP